ncbi:hypothetical protein BH10ACT10_BH10ACT10_16530 [soil metagenome]
MRKFADRFLPVISIAALVAALVLGAGSLKSLVSGTDGTDAPLAAAPPMIPNDDPAVTDLDLGATTSDDVTACLTPPFATDVDSVDVLYGVRQHRLGGSSSVLVLRNADGDVRLCDQFGGDAPSQAPQPTTTSSRPVAFLSTARSSWTCAGTTKVLQKFEQSTWLVVAPEVATVQQRYWVGGVAGPWFESEAQGGYAHLQTWLEGPEPAATTYAAQFRVLDADGDEITQKALPTDLQALAGCNEGGSAQIG